MTVAIVGIGLPGSGKSTLLKRIAGVLGCSYISSDETREEFTGDMTDQTCTPEVRVEILRRIQAELEAGRSVVVDATNTDRADRQRMIDRCRAHANRVIGIWFDPTYAECQRRNLARTRKVPEFVMEKMARALEQFPPSRHEGFDELTRCHASLPTGH